MLHQVKILSPEGKTKKVVTSAELSARHWKHFYDAENNVSLVSNGRTRIPTWVKNHLDLKFSGLMTNPA